MFCLFCMQRFTRRETGIRCGREERSGSHLMSDTLYGFRCSAGFNAEMWNLYQTIDRTVFNDQRKESTFGMHCMSDVWIGIISYVTTDIGRSGVIGWSVRNLSTFRQTNEG